MGCIPSTASGGGVGANSSSQRGGFVGVGPDDPKQQHHHHHDQQPQPASAVGAPGKAAKRSAAYVEHFETEMMRGQIVQTFCILAVLRENDLVIQQVSRNTERLVGVKPEAIAGETVDVILREESVDVIRTTLRTGRSNEELSAAMPLHLTSADGKQWVGVLHRPPGSENDQGGTVVLELEPKVESGPAQLPHGLACTAVDAYPAAALAKAKERIQSEFEEGKLCQAVTEAVSAVTGFDRVCCYGFSKVGHGQVRGETLLDKSLPPFFGLRFPASDIPMFSRAIFYSTRARLMLDANDEGVGLYPEVSPSTNRALDMYYCNARAPTPCCRLFHVNINSCSQLVFSVIVGNKLWGIVTGHTRALTYVAYRARTALVPLVQLFARCLDSVLKDRSRAAKERAMLVPAELLGKGAPPAAELYVDTLAAADGALHAGVRGVIPDCCGAAVLDRARTKRVGSGDTPAAAELERIAGLLQGGKTAVRKSASSGDAAGTGAPAHLVWTTENAAEECAADGAAAGWQGGFVALQLPGGHFAFWFRHPVKQEVKWAGDKAEPYTEGPDGKLGPRNSFALWKEAVADRCEQWEDGDVVAARYFGVSLASALGPTPAA